LGSSRRRKELSCTNFILGVLFLDINSGFDKFNMAGFAKESVAVRIQDKSFEALGEYSIDKQIIIFALYFVFKMVGRRAGGTVRV
jgi:hypothetical protein